MTSATAEGSIKDNIAGGLFPTGTSYSATEALLVIKMPAESVLGNESILKLMEILGNSTLIAILAILSVSTILSLLKSLGWMPSFLKIRVDAENVSLIKQTLHQAGVTDASKEKIVGETLKQLGIDTKVSWYRSVNQVMNIRSDFDLPESHPDLQRTLKSIVASHIEVEKITIGSASQRPVNYFVNLRRAFCVGSADEVDRRLAELMLAHIRECFRRHGISADAVAARKSGLNMLAYLVARTMGLPLILFAESASLWNPRPGEEKTARPRHLDYLPQDIHTAIIVDDSCVGGGSFRDLANVLRRHEIIVEHAFVLFARKEVDAVTALRQEGVSLHPLDLYSDADLAPLVDKAAVSSSLEPAKCNISQASV